MATDIERLISEIKTLTPEQKSELARRLDEESIFDDDQTWYWSPEWQAAEKEVDKDIKAGGVKRFTDVDRAIKFLHEQVEKPDGE